MSIADAGTSRDGGEAGRSTCSSPTSLPPLGPKLPRRRRSPDDYPISLRLAGVPVLVVGGGRIAEGRVAGLAGAGARIRIVAPRITPRLRRRVERGGLQWTARPFELGDVRGARFVFVATDSREVNRAAAFAARALGLLVNAADMPELCDFTLPAIGRRGLLTVAVSSGGRSPTAARVARDAAVSAVGPAHVKLAALLARLREQLPAGSRADAARALVAGGALRLLAAGDRAGLARLVRRVSARGA